MLVQEAQTLSVAFYIHNDTMTDYIDCVSVSCAGVCFTPSYCYRYEGSMVCPGSQSWGHCYLAIML